MTFQHYFSFHICDLGKKATWQTSPQVCPFLIPWSILKILSRVLLLQTGNVFIVFLGEGVWGVWGGGEGRVWGTRTVRTPTRTPTRIPTKITTKITCNINSKWYFAALRFRPTCSRIFIKGKKTKILKPTHILTHTICKFFGETLVRWLSHST